MDTSDIYPGSVWTRTDKRPTYVAIVRYIQNGMVHWTDNNTGNGLTMLCLWREMFVPAKIVKVERMQA